MNKPEDRFPHEPQATLQSTPFTKQDFDPLLKFETNHAQVAWFDEDISQWLKDAEKGIFLVKTENGEIAAAVYYYRFRTKFVVERVVLNLRLDSEQMLDQIMLSIDKQLARTDKQSLRKGETHITEVAVRDSDHFLYNYFSNPKNGYTLALTHHQRHRLDRDPKKKKEFKTEAEHYFQRKFTR